MSGRGTHGLVLDVAANTACGSTAATLVAVVAWALGLPVGAAVPCALIAICVVCWRMYVWNDRQDELEAKRSEVDS